MRVVNDIDVENAIVDIKTANGEDTNQATGTSVTTLQPNAPVYYFGMVNSTSTDFTNDMSGWSKVIEVETGGDEFLSCAMFTQTKTAVGATGAMTSTLTDATKEFAIVTLAFGVPVEDEVTEGSNPSGGGGVQVTLDSVPFDYVLSTPQTKIQVMLGDA